jgi:O-acetyl-ADP-ribose deacetylase (regulator of RNase III)
MEITYRTGDIFETESPIIIHGCNAQGTYNAGFAKQVREQLPFAYTVYRQVYLERGLNLGEVVWAINIAEGQRSRIVGNAITQADYGSDGRQRVNYAAVRQAFREVDGYVRLSRDHPQRLCIPEFGVITSVSMPAIGSGGGDWTIIAAIIEEESLHFTPIVYLRNGKI